MAVFDLEGGVCRVSSYLHRGQSPQTSDGNGISYREDTMVDVGWE